MSDRETVDVWEAAKQVLGESLRVGYLMSIINGQPMVQKAVQELKDLAAASLVGENLTFSLDVAALDAAGQFMVLFMTTPGGEDKETHVKRAAGLGAVLGQYGWQTDPLLAWLDLETPAGTNTVLRLLLRYVADENTINGPLQ
jgi:hypothetical protein